MRARTSWVIAGGRGVLLWDTYNSSSIYYILTKDSVEIFSQSWYCYILLESVPVVVLCLLDTNSTCMAFAHIMIDSNKLCTHMICAHIIYSIWIFSHSWYMRIAWSTKKIYWRVYIDIVSVVSRCVYINIVSTYLICLHYAYGVATISSLLNY